MKKSTTLIGIMLLLLFTAGCGKEEAAPRYVMATSPLEGNADLLANVSITLPEAIRRESVSDSQHDFILEDKQIGGIVIVDIPAEMLDAPRENTLQIAQLLGQQLMPTTEEAKYQYAGGNDYAYMELATGKTKARFLHYLFRGNAACYDVWFDLEAVKQKTINGILASVSAEDIRSEWNENVF